VARQKKAEGLAKAFTAQGVGRPLVAGQGRRGEGGAVLGRHEGMQMAPSELYQAARHNPEMWLDPKIQQRRPGETESQHHARLLATSIAAGYRDENGVPVDVMALHGFTQERAERELAKSLRGEPNALDFVSANVDAQTLAQVDAGMLARHATNRQTGALAVEDKLVQVAASQKELQRTGDALKSVKDAALAVTGTLSSSSSAADLLASMDALVSAGVGAYQQAAGVVVTTEVFKQDIDGKQNLAEVLAQTPQLVAPLEQAQADFEARFAPLKEIVTAQIAPAKQTIASYEATAPAVRQQLQKHLDDEKKLREQLSRASEEGRAALQQQLDEMAGDARRTTLEAQLADLERQKKEAQETISASTRTLQVEMSIIGKADIGKLAKQVEQVRTSGQEAIRRSQSRYEAELGAVKRTGAAKPLQTRFDNAVAAPLP
jgi:hypothetical protein